MKRLLLLLWILLISVGLMGTAGATPSTKSDLNSYFKEIQKVEKKHLGIFRLSLLEISDTELQPQNRKELLETKVLPNLDNLLRDWRRISPKTEEVRTINDRYRSAYQTMREGLELRGKAWDLEQIEANLLTVGNIQQAQDFRIQINQAHDEATKKLNEASLKAEEAMILLGVLANQTKTKEIPPLYLLSPGSGSAR